MAYQGQAVSRWVLSDGRNLPEVWCWKPLNVTVKACMLLGWFRYWYFPALQISANVTFLLSAFKKTFLLSNFLSLFTIFGIPTKDAQIEFEYCIRLFTLFWLLPKEMPGFCNCPVSWIISEFIGQLSHLRRELEAGTALLFLKWKGDTSEHFCSGGSCSIYLLHQWVGQCGQVIFT